MRAGGGRGGDVCVICGGRRQRFLEKGGDRGEDRC
jgi:hypothetical protein